MLVWSELVVVRGVAQLTISNAGNYRVGDMVTVVAGGSGSYTITGVSSLTGKITFNFPIADITLSSPETFAFYGNIYYKAANFVGVQNTSGDPNSANVVLYPGGVFSRCGLIIPPYNGPFDTQSETLPQELIGDLSDWWYTPDGTHGIGAILY
jgi:hypothetical protein